MKKKKRELDYRAFYVIGLSLFVVGLATKIYGLFAGGLVLFIIGLANRDKWSKEKKKVKKK